MIELERIAELRRNQAAKEAHEKYKLGQTFNNSITESSWMITQMKEHSTRYKRATLELEVEVEVEVEVTSLKLKSLKLKLKHFLIF